MEDIKFILWLWISIVFETVSCNYWASLHLLPCSNFICSSSVFLQSACYYFIEFRSNLCTGVWNFSRPNKIRHFYNHVITFWVRSDFLIPPHLLPVLKRPHPNATQRLGDRHPLVTWSHKLQNGRGANATLVVRRLRTTIHHDEDVYLGRCRLLRRLSRLLDSSGWRNPLSLAAAEGDSHMQASASRLHFS